MRTWSDSWRMSWKRPAFYASRNPSSSSRLPHFRLMPASAQIMAAIVDQIERIGHIGLDGNRKDAGHRPRRHHELRAKPARLVEVGSRQEQLPHRPPATKARALEEQPKDRVALAVLSLGELGKRLGFIRSEVRLAAPNSDRASVVFLEFRKPRLDIEKIDPYRVVRPRFQHG